MTRRLALLVLGFSIAPACSTSPSAVAPPPAAASQALTPAVGVSADEERLILEDVGTAVLAAMGPALSRIEPSALPERAWAYTMDKARVLISENAMARSAAARLTPEERRTAEELSRRSVEALIAANGGTSEAADAAFAQSYSSLAYESRRKRSEAFIAVHFDRHIKPRVTVTDAEIQAAFERDSAVFNTPAAADFSTVTLHVARDLQVNPAAATAEDWARAERVTLGRAEDVRKQIAAGASFAPLAERYSQDPKALAGGRWRHLSRHSFVREDFEDKVFSLTPDAPPEVVVSRTQDPSQTWVVVVQLHALTPAKMVSLAEARPQLEAKLREHRTGELLSRFYGEALEENASLGKRSTEDLKTYFQTAILPKLRAAQAQLEGKPKGTRAVSATTPPS